MPIELKPDHLKIEPDHVLADMLRSMHLIVREANEAFEPEGGAYGGARAARPWRIRMAARAPVGPVLHPDAYGGAVTTTSTTTITTTTMAMHATATRTDA